MKNNIRTYLVGFFSGFGNIFAFWEMPKFKDNKIQNIPLLSLDEMNLNSFNNSWYQVSLNLKQACNNIANKYGYKNEQQR